MELTDVPTTGNVQAQQIDLIRSCSLCNRIEGTDGQWNDIIPELRQVYESGMLLTHGMCSPCYVKNYNSLSPPI